MPFDTQYNVVEEKADGRVAVETEAGGSAYVANKLVEAGIEEQAIHIRDDGTVDAIGRFELPEDLLDVANYNPNVTPVGMGGDRMTFKFGGEVLQE